MTINDAEFIDKMKTGLISAAMRVNQYAIENDIGRNHTNYASASTYSYLLNLLGVETDIACWGDGDYLKIPKITIDSKTTRFEQGE